MFKISKSSTINNKFTLKFVIKKKREKQNDFKFIGI